MKPPLIAGCLAMDNVFTLVQNFASRNVRSINQCTEDTMLRIGSSIVSAFVVILAAWWSPSAGALVVTGGFSGQIFSSGGDLSGFFGTGGDLSDLPISGTFRYDTQQVPPPNSTGPNSAIYTDPTFSTNFLDFSVSINGRSYTFGAFPALPGIQSIEVIDNTDQLLFDYQRFGISDSESLALRFVSDVDFLIGIGVPTHFDFIASGVGLTPGGTFSFDLANGDSASASFSIDTGFARPAQVPEPATLSAVALGLFGIAAARRRSVRSTRRCGPASPSTRDVGCAASPPCISRGPAYEDGLSNRA